MNEEMYYKVPFHDATEALKATLEACSALNLTWFDGDTPPETVNTYFKQQTEFSYGIFSESDADLVDNKSVALWDFWLDLEIYSNYKGRKVVAQKLETLLNYLSSEVGFADLCQRLSNKGYNLLSVEMGKLHISLPIRGDYGVWQNGSIPLVLHLEQAD